jgi:uncharacterized protein (UPF0548 family)
MNLVVGTHVDSTAGTVEGDRTPIRRSVAPGMERDGTCQHWLMVAASDSLEGTAGTIDHYERVVVVPAGMGPEETFGLLEARLLDYRIFPPSIMRAEVCSDDGRVHNGTTIIQHVAVGPFRLEAAVRVIRVWRGRDPGAEEIGFTYATLEGHPERGVSSFSVRWNVNDQVITFVIDARSQPASLVARLTRPLARRFQRQATEAALAHFTALPG